MKLLKYIFSTLILSWTLSVYSAPSDCQQLETDGTVNCLPSSISFSYGDKQFDTVEELTSYLVNLICSSYGVGYECYAQQEPLWITFK